jgi:hypothetical protein
MTLRWSDLGAEGQRLATAHFVTSALASGLSAACARPESGEIRSRRPRFADLYAWVTDPAHDLAPEQQAMVQADPVLRRDLALLVGRVGQFRALSAAAASSGGLSERSGPGFTLRLSVSRADPAQTYVTIEIDQAVLSRAEPPSVLLVMRDGVPFAKVALPELPEGELSDGVIQVIAASEGDAVRGLRAAETELVLV